MTERVTRIQFTDRELIAAVVLVVLVLVGTVAVGPAVLVFVLLAAAVACGVVSSRRVKLGKEYPCDFGYEFLKIDEDGTVHVRHIDRDALMTGKKGDPLAYVDGEAHPTGSKAPVIVEADIEEQTVLLLRK